MKEEDILLLEKFLDGCCTKEELHQVNRLLDSISGQNMLDKLIEQREIFELNNPPQDDWLMQELVNVRWEKMYQHIVTSKNSRRTFLTRNVLHRISIAAVFAGVIILSGVLLWNKNNNGTGLFGSKIQTVTYTELNNPDGIPELYELPDGTQIWLAARSSLIYPESFDNKQRDVELSGEAFFNVARDESRPFTIHTGDMQTRVLGTSFKVTAFAGQEQEVSVATGKVSVSSNGQELTLLTRGRQVRHNPETGETIQAQFDPNSLEQWKTGTLIFDELPMHLVAKQLENRYGIKIDFTDPKIANILVSSIFLPDQSVTSILHILGRVGKFQYKSINDKQYIIY